MRMNRIQWGLCFVAMCAGGAFAENAATTKANVSAASSMIPVKIVQMHYGNYFRDLEPVMFRLETLAPVVAYRVTDAYGVCVAEGEWPITGGSTDVVVPVTKRGHYVIQLWPKSKTTTSSNTASAAAKRIETSFAILAPLGFDLKAVTDSPFGICTHFAQGWVPEAMAVAELAGIKTIRDEMYWGAVEQKKGEYNFDMYWYSGYAKRAGIRPDVGLTYGNDFYDEGAGPYTEEGVAAYAAYAGAMVGKFGGDLEAVEVWNEYNCGFNTKKTGNSPDTYIKMLKATYEKVKAVRPETPVVGVSMSCLIWDWLERFFKAGGLKYCDAVSVHPYRWERWDLPPETMDADFAKLRAMIDQYNNTGRKIAIWSTEVSWPTVPKWNVTEFTQAEYIVRTYAVLMNRGVARNYWYDLVCDRYEGIEGAFGVVRHWTDERGALTPKPAFVALAVMTRQLTNWTFAARENVDPDVWCLRFAKGNETKRLMWSMRPMVVSVKTSGPVDVMDMMGNTTQLTPIDGSVMLGLNGSPVYVVGPIESVSPTSMFSIVTKQTLAVNDAIDLRCVSKTSGTLEIEGKEYTIEANAPQKVISMGAIDSPTMRTFVYRWKVGTQVVGLGRLTVQVADALTLRDLAAKKKDLLEGVVRNGSISAEYRIESIEWRIGEKSGKATIDRSLKAASSETLVAAIPALTSYAIVPASMKVNLSNGVSVEATGDVSFSPCERVRDAKVGPTLAIDLAKVGTVRVKDYRGPADLSVKAGIGYDDERFYLTVAIDDDHYVQRFPAEEAWRGDGIQFGIARDGDNCYEFVLTKTADGVHVACTQLPVATNGELLIAASSFSVTQQGTTTIYRCAIPWRMLPPMSPKDDSVRVSLLVNENDGDGRRGWIAWADGIGEAKSVERYQRIIFASEK